MIRNRFLLLLALPMLALAGCSEDVTEPQVPGTNDTGTIAFEIGFAGQDAQTRVATDKDFNSAFEDGDQIGIFAIESGQPLAANDNPIHNVPLTYNKATGKWSGTALWPAGVAALDFFAYYPYDASATDPTAIAFAVKADQSAATDSKSNYNLSDLLAAQSDNGGTGWAKGSTVALTFSHMLAMVQLTIDTEADGIDFDKDVAVTLQGVKTATTLDLSVRMIDAPSGDPGDVVMHLAATDGTKRLYRALVPAQTVAAGTKLFRIENGDQKLTSDALTAEMTLTASTAELFTLSGGGGTTDPDIDDVLAEIKDDNFRAAVTTLMTDEGWDANTDGKLSPAEAAAVTGEMNVSNKEIASLAGIEYFTALTQLNCSGNTLGALDVSKNTALTSLDCYGNTLTTLDVSKNTKLIYLRCSDNALTTLDVSKNTALTYLSCYGNTLTTLDVTKNTKLTSLYCYYNALTTLDVSKNTALTTLYCGDGSTALTVTVDAAEHDISTDGNLEVYASNGSGSIPSTRITALNTETHGVTVTAVGTSGDPAVQNYRITWKDGKYALTTDPTDAGLYFKFGSVAGIFSGDGTNQTLPAKTNDAFDAGDIAWNPTDATTWETVPLYGDYPANVDAAYHTAANVKAGKGDPCRLVGLDLAKIESTAAGSLTTADIDNGEWRLPTHDENQTFSGYSVYTATSAHWTTSSSVNGGMFPDKTSGSEATFLPAAGYRISSTGAVTFQGTYGHYWSSVPSGASGVSGGYYLRFSSSSVYPVIGSSYADGFAVRCVRQ